MSVNFKKNIKKYLTRIKNFCIFATYLIKKERKTIKYKTMTTMMIHINSISNWRRFQHGLGMFAFES